MLPFLLYLVLSKTQRLLNNEAQKEGEGEARAGAHMTVLDIRVRAYMCGATNGKGFVYCALTRAVLVLLSSLA